MSKLTEIHLSNKFEDLIDILDDDESIKSLHEINNFTNFRNHGVETIDLLIENGLVAKSVDIKGGFDQPILTLTELGSVICKNYIYEQTSFEVKVHRDKESKWESVDDNDARKVTDDDESYDKIVTLDESDDDETYDADNDEIITLNERDTIGSNTDFVFFSPKNSPTNIRL